MAWLVCLSAGLFFFYEFFQLNLFDVINQSLRDEFQINARQLSWMSSSFLLANILFLLPAGVILDRYSVRHVILLAMVTCVVGTIGFGLSHSFLWATIFHFLTGIGNAFAFLSCVVLISRWFPPRRQALMIGVVVTMAFFGGMVAHTPLVYLNDHFGWRQSLLLVGGVGVLLIVWLFRVLKDKPFKEPVELQRPNESMLTSFLSATKNRQNWLCGVYISCLNLPIMVLGALWGASYLTTVHQLPMISASNIVSCLFIGSMIGCPLIGWFSDSLGRRKFPMLLGALMTLLVFIPLFMHVIFSETILCVIFALIGFFTSAQVVGYPCVAESNNPNHTGAATGIASVVIMGGGGVGQILFGQLMQYHAGKTSHIYTVADFQFAMWLFPVTIFIAVMALVFTRETFCGRLVEE